MVFPFLFLPLADAQFVRPPPRPEAGSDFVFPSTATVDTVAWLILAGFAVVVLLSVVGWRLRAREEGPPAPPPGPPRWVLVDGSNVMHWNGEKPDWLPLRQVVGQLGGRGYTPGVVFDANVGYKLRGSFMNDRALAAALGLPVDRVLVAPKGTQADYFLLEAARDLGAPVVTNDRFRDWAESYPEVTKPGFLIRGGFRGGEVWMEEGEGEG